MGSAQSRGSGMASWVGAAIGVVALLGFVGFAVGLPEVAEAPGEEAGEGESAPAAEVSLPDQLPGGWIPDDTVDPSRVLPPGNDPAQLAEQAKQLQDSAASGLTELFEVPAVVRGYSQPETGAQVSMTVLATGPGLFAPVALPIDPGLLQAARLGSVLEEVDDAVCSLTFVQPVPAGQPVDPAEVPRELRCQLGVDGSTYELFGVGLTPEAAVDLLQAAADAS